MTKITDVQITPIRPNKGLVALASCILDDKYYLGGIGIYTKKSGGYRLTYPTKKVGQGSVNIHNPIVKECSKEIENQIITKYEIEFEASLEL